MAHELLLRLLMKFPLRYVIVLLFSFLWLACGAAAVEVTSDGAVVETSSPVDWYQGLASSLATDETYLFVGAGDTLISIRHDNQATKTLFSVPLGMANEDNIISEIYPAGLNVIVAVLIDRINLTPPSREQRRQLWTVPLTGAPATLHYESIDPREFLGVATLDDFIYYSSFTALLKMPIAGGPTRFVAESPNDTQYWVLTPTIFQSNIFWAEGASIFVKSLLDAGEKGSLVATFATYDFNPLSLVPSEPGKALVNINGPLTTSIATIDLAQGRVVGPTVDLGVRAPKMALTSGAIWAITWDGLLYRFGRDGTNGIMVSDGVVGDAGKSRFKKRGLATHGNFAYAASSIKVVRFAQ